MKKQLVALFALIALVGLTQGDGFPALTDKPIYDCTPYLSDIIAGLQGLKMYEAIEAPNIGGITYDPSQWQTGVDDECLPGTVSGQREVSAEGGVTLYVMIPQIVNTYASSPVKFCAQYWANTVYNTYTFTLINTVDSSQTLTCDLDEVHSEYTDTDRPDYLALQCPNPPISGRYQVFVQTTIDLDTYFSDRDLSQYPESTVVYEQTNFEYSESACIYFTEAATSTITHIVPNEISAAISFAVAGKKDNDDITNIKQTILVNVNIAPLKTRIDSQFTPSNLDLDNTYNVNSPPEICGGLFSYNETTEKGATHWYFKSIHYHFEEETTYHVAVVPQILSISPSSGFGTGQIITISGSGFSPYDGECEVNFAGHSCDILPGSSTVNRLTCAMEEIDENAPELSQSAEGSSGVLHEIFYNYNGTYYDLATDAVTVPSSSELLHTSEVIHQSECGFYERLTKYFKAPTTGLHRFPIAAKGPVSVYMACDINSTDGSYYGHGGLDVNVSYLKLIKNSTIDKGFRDYSENDDDFSVDVNLVEGSLYKIVVVHQVILAYSYVTLGVEVPVQIQGTNHMPTIQTLQVNFTYNPGTYSQSYCYDYRNTSLNVWTANFYTGTIYFGFYDFQEGQLITLSTYESTFTTSIKFDANNPDVDAISAELTTLNGGRRVQVVRYAVGPGGSINAYGQISGCVKLAASNLTQQTGWGFDITLLDPMPYWWYDENLQPFVLYAFYNQDLSTNIVVTADTNGVLGRSGGDNFNYAFTGINSWYNNYQGDDICFGTWNFTLNGIQSSIIDYNIDGPDLTDLFRQQFSQYVVVIVSGYPESGLTWKITFDSWVGDAPLITTGSFLFDDPTVTVVVTKTQVGRTNLLVSPISNELSRLRVATPEIIVIATESEVNSIMEQVLNIKYLPPL